MAPLHSGQEEGGLLSRNTGLACGSLTPSVPTHRPAQAPQIWGTEREGLSFCSTFSVMQMGVDTGDHTGSRGRTAHWNRARCSGLPDYFYSLKETGKAQSPQDTGTQGGRRTASQEQVLRAASLQLQRLIERSGAAPAKPRTPGEQFKRRKSPSFDPSLCAVSQLQRAGAWRACFCEGQLNVDNWFFCHED